MVSRSQSLSPVEIVIIADHALKTAYAIRYLLHSSDIFYKYSKFLRLSKIYTQICCHLLSLRLAIPLFKQVVGYPLSHHAHHSMYPVGISAVEVAE